MNKGWGGGKLRNSLIEQKEGYLGPYHDEGNSRMVKIGGYQNFVYQEGEYPFNLTADERETKKNDVQIPIPDNEQVEKPRLKDEIVADLMETEWGKQEVA